MTERKTQIAWTGEALTSEEMELSKSVVGKCGGLPKVIAAIGEVCRSDRWFRLDWLRSLKDNFMGKLETKPEFHGLRPLFSWMQSYFDGCSDSLKPCIFYLSIFYAEKNIRRRRLLWRWIAEGYCRDTSDGRTCEDNWDRFVSELVSLSIVQGSPGKSKAFCQINGFFHEYIMSRPMGDNLVFALEERCSLNSTRAGQNLTIRSSWDRRDRIVYESIDFSRLRSLTVFGKWEPFFVSSKKITMRLLRVLDLEDAQGVSNEDLEQIAERLPRLKFLSLRGCREITCLPSSMGGLRQLQTLDVRHTSIATLPPVITKLQKLRYIRAGTTTEEVWDWEGDDVVVPAAHADDGEQAVDRAAAAQAVVTNDLPAAAATPTELPAEAAGSSSSSVVSCNNRRQRPRTLASSFLSKLKLCRRGDGGHHYNKNGRPVAAGVTIPADVDIGKLAVLHTLGVVKVRNAQCSSNNKAIFEALKQLTQLRKLGVSGINKGNIHGFCEAISGHARLKSLSVQVDDKDGGDLDGNIPQPPKGGALSSLKLYGHANRLLVWIGQLGSNLEKLKLDLTIANPEELGEPESSWVRAGHLRIRPIQDGELRIGNCWRFACVVEIQCRSELHIKFDDIHPLWWNVEVLKLHFSGSDSGSGMGGSPRSSLNISGLGHLRDLREVWLKGYTDALHAATD